MNTPVTKYALCICYKDICLHTPVTKHALCMHKGGTRLTSLIRRGVCARLLTPCVALLMFCQHPCGISAAVSSLTSLLS